LRDTVSAEPAGLAAAIRARVLELTPTDSPSHVSSALSLVEIFAALYGDFLDLDGIRAQAEDRDRVILSKGHAALAWYATLAQCGVITDDAIDDYGAGAARATIHPRAGLLTGIEATSGSLGHGLAVGAGMALGNALRPSAARTVVILGDGELQEGSVWEAALFAGNRGLGGLTAIVDMNGLQQTGRVAEIGGLNPLAAKWRAFGWQVERVDGHDLGEVVAALGSSLDPARPRAILAETVKGRGVPAIEDRDGWHFRALGVQVNADA
jgi:transketolase